MKTQLTLISFLLTFLFFNSSFGNIEKGKWTFIKDPDYCYIGSIPEKIDIPEGKKRGDPYILVYRINKSKNPIVQIEAGYPYKKNQDVRVKIDKADYTFYSEDETAWTNEDSEIIYAMKKGNYLTVIGESSRGTKTKDTYTLKGFTAAFNKLINDC